MAASFPSVTVLISPEVLFTGNEFCELLDSKIFGLVFEGCWCCTGNIFRWRTMAASFPSVTALISPEVVFTGKNSCELLDSRLFDLIFEGSWCRHWKYLPMENDGGFVPQCYGVDIS